MNQFVLNNLYSNGIINHTFPDMYENAMLSNPYMQTPYLDVAMSGSLYRQQGTMLDSFYHQQPAQQMVQFNKTTVPIKDCNIDVYGPGKLGDNAISIWKKIPAEIKGLFAGGIMLGTLCSCLKRGKKPPVNTNNNTGFFNKLFKKKKKVNN